jgi:hypothetical protein
MWRILFKTKMLGGCFCCFAWGMVQSRLFKTITSSQRMFITERIDEMLESQSKWLWLGYLMNPIFIVIQTGLMTVCINCGAFIMDFKIKFTTIFKIVLKSSVVFLIWKMLVTFIFLFMKIKVFDDLIKAD